MNLGKRVFEGMQYVASQMDRGYISAGGCAIMRCGPDTRD